MKNLFILSFLVLLAGCAQMADSGLTASSTTSQKMKACLISEANTRYQAGTLFTSSVKSTASDLVKTCTKKLALQSMGISTENQYVAESIISNLKAMSGN